MKYTQVEKTVCFSRGGSGAARQGREDSDFDDDSEEDETENDSGSSSSSASDEFPSSDIEQRTMVDTYVGNCFASRENGGIEELFRGQSIDDVAEGSYSRGSTSEYLLKHVGNASVYPGKLTNEIVQKLLTRCPVDEYYCCTNVRKRRKQYFLSHV